MKIIGIDDEEEKIKKLNKKKVMWLAGICTLIIMIIVLVSVYMGNKAFREFIDKYIFMKNVAENNLPSITLDKSENNYIYAYDKYISVFNQNSLIGYNSSGKKEYELTVEITNPIVDTNNRFLLMAENEKQKIYLISGNSIVWEKELEGNISRVSVNKNGYVSVIVTGTTHKSIIQTFDAAGKEMFKIYLSSSIAMDSDISYDNKYLSFAEVSTSGTITQAIIKTVLIPKAQDGFIYTINAPSDSVPLNIEYQEGNKLICMYDNSIHCIQNDKDEEILKLNESGKKITFADVELNNYTFRIIETSFLLNTDSSIEIMNVGNKKTNIYTINSAIKEVNCYDDAIALNLGSEIHFVGTNGWLIKKYTSSQEIRKIVMNNNFAGIVYRNKIEIVNL